MKRAVSVLLLLLVFFCAGKVPASGDSDHSPFLYLPGLSWESTPEDLRDYFGDSLREPTSTE